MRAFHTLRQMEILVGVLAVALRCSGSPTSSPERTRSSDGYPRGTRRAGSNEPRSRHRAPSMHRGAILDAGRAARRQVRPRFLRQPLDRRPPRLGALVRRCPVPPRPARRGTAAIADRTPPHAAEVETAGPDRWLRGDAIPVDEGGSVLLVVSDAPRLDGSTPSAGTSSRTPRRAEDAAASIQAAETIGTAGLDDPSVVPRFAAQLERAKPRVRRGSSRPPRPVAPRDRQRARRVPWGSTPSCAMRSSGSRPRRRGRHRAPRRREAQPRFAARTRARLGVRNLVDNAIRYTRPGGGVDVRASPRPAVRSCWPWPTPVSASHAGPGPRLRALPPGPRSFPRDGRHGLSLDRPPRRPEPRRQRRRDERARFGLDVRDPTAGNVRALSSKHRGV